MTPKHIAFRKNIVLTAVSLLGFLWVASSSVYAQSHHRLEKAPLYRSYEKHSVDVRDRTVHGRVMIDPMMSSEFFYRGREDALQPIADALDRYVDSLGWSSRIESISNHGRGRPYVFVGSSEGETAPDGADMLRADHERFAPIMIYADKPSRDWRRAAAQRMTEEKADYLVLLWIGLSEYPKTERGFFRKKVILGTDYEPDIRFLSADDEPVEVLHITGMLFDYEGRLLRAGSEGIIHEDTPFWAQSFGVATTINDDTMNRLLTKERREDLPGRPLAWKVAAYNMMEQLLQRPRSF